MYVEKGFLSTTYDKSIVDNYLGGEYTVSLEINSKNGVMIDKVSYFDKEKEVLFNKGSKFRIDEIINESEQRKIIKLTEL